MKICDKVKRYPWAEEALQELREELDRLVRNGYSIPVEPGGWWHQYVCPSHHTELLFDPYERQAEAFLCPHGCQLTGEPYRGAWLVFKHQSLARFALQAAAVYAATREKRYGELGRDLIVRYAGQFPHYPVHPDAQPWMLKGRAFHQALTEAVWATTLLRAYGLLQEEGVSFEDDAPVLDRFFSLLEESMVQYRRILIEEKRNPENNYTAWLNAALSCIYAIRGDRKKLDALVEGEGGIVHHLSIGVKADGFEFEGATYYHVFVLRAYLIAAEMAEKLGRNLYEAAGSEGQSFRSMLDVLIGLADDQGDLPALHDGPYRRVPYSREIAEVMEIGLARYGMTSCGSVLGAVYQDLYGTRRQRGLEALLFGTGAVDLSAPPEAAREGLLLKESGFAVLRYPGSPISVLADFGPHGGSHGHYDKLHISLSHAKGKLTPELGMVPYGSALRREWYAETASHNTVSVNGASQAPHTGECVRYEQREDGTYLHIRSKDAYPGCVMDRHLLLTSHWMLDWFEITLEEAGTVDWHCYGAAGFQPVNRDGWEEGPAEDPAQLLAGMLGNPHIQPAGRVGGGASAASGGKWQSFRIPVASSGGKGTAGEIAMATLMFPDSILLAVKAPGTADDPARIAEGLLHRRFGTSIRFITICCDGTTTPDLEWRESPGGEDPYVLIGTRGRTSTITLDREQGIGHSIQTEQEVGNHE